MTAMRRAKNASLWITYGGSKRVRLDGVWLPDEADRDAEDLATYGFTVQVRSSSGRALIREVRPTMLPRRPSSGGARAKT